MSPVRRKPYTCVTIALAGAALTIVEGQVSETCRENLDAMVLQDENWQFVNTSVTRWCRLRLENKMATCCTLADFALGRGEQCSNNCEADCQHQHMIQLCNSYFGLACTVVRNPFPNDAKALKVRETFCVPGDCTKSANQDVLMVWFATRFQNIRYGWQEDYSMATLECPDGLVMIGVIMALIVLFCIAMVPVGIFLFKAPKERGRMLISQEEMMQGQDDDNGQTADLRGAGQGGYDSYDQQPYE